MNPTHSLPFGPPLPRGRLALRARVGHFGRRPAAGPPGSTLLELIVVLAIVGLLFGVAVPAMTAIPAREDLVTSADSVRTLAVREGRPVVADSFVALPDGRMVPRRGSDAR